ncbi:hypothetical protein [Actinomyces trachealis]|uniref:hypothetical protein n=1 Tax=Actinomyces trachealis TaxID=2763540 RepID=UPI0018C72A31|nr:hypothetical protein [Actinomyces trachealis]
MNAASIGLTLYPICQPEFIQANELLSRADQEDGRVIFDDMNSVDPDLLKLELASPPWPEGFQVGGKDADTWKQVDPGPMLSSHKDHGMRATPSRHIVGKRDPYSFSQNVKVWLSDRLPVLLSLMENDGIAVEGLSNRVARGLLGPDAVARGLLAKVQSIFDVVEPRCVDLCVLKLSSSAVRYDVAFVRWVQTIEIPSATTRVQELRSQFAREVANEDLSGVEVTLGCPRQNEYVLTILGMPEDVESVVYWYLDGDKIATDWYSNESVRRLCPELVPSAAVRAMVFMRRRSSAEASRVVNVELRQ